MILTFVEAQSLARTPLPELADGVVRICDRAGRDVLHAQGKSGAWRLSPCAGCVPAAPLPERVTGGMFLRLTWQGRGALLLAQENGAAGKLARMGVPEVMDVTVGSARDNSIVFAAPTVAPRQLTLRHRRGSWELHAPEGAVYVNGRRSRGGRLAPGDEVFTMGLMLIPFPGGLAVNCPSEAMSFGTWRPVRREADAGRAPAFVAPEPVWFSRMPRFRTAVETAQLSVQLPPSMASQPQAQSALSMGPALTSGLFMMLGGLGSVASLGMIAGNLAFPLLGHRKAQKEYEENEKRRQEAYRAYLAKTEQQLRAGIAQNQTRLLELTPETSAEAAALLHDRRHLWERRARDEDFLALRLGTGDIPLRCSLEASMHSPGDADDPLQASLSAFLEQDWALHGVPIVLAADRFQVVGVSGPERMRAQLLVRVMTQFALHVAYDELRLCVLGALPAEAEPLLRLPHLWNEERTLRYAAAREEEVTGLLPALEQEVAARQTEHGEAGELVVVIPDEAVARRHAVVSLLMERKLSRVHVLVLAAHSSGLPSACGAVIGLREGRGVLRTVDGEGSIAFCPDADALPPLEKLVHLLENTWLEPSQAARRIPDTVPFLQLFDAAKPEALNIAARWRRNTTVSALSAPLGIDGDGQLCALDVHEKAQGPHGLIAGTTGSGKSELIITYILGLAVNYSPDEVCFALIDYKGGGTANVFLGLPHLAGAVSNLGGSAVQRCLVSIKSELTRRQAMLAAAKVNKINDYHRCLERGEVSEPLPHLLIVVDEFAELKSSEPEFMAELIRVARVGRSLGVHMILSTQKPAGVVDEQIESNTSFRICLRVQTPQDSQEMLGCPDAAGLRGMGRFLIKSQDSMTEAQSGWTGAPLGGTGGEQADCEAEVLDAQGRVLHRRAVPRRQKKSAGVQLDAVLEQIKSVGEATGLRARPLWLPELPETLPLDALRERYGENAQPYRLCPLLGEVDRPREQTRTPLRLALNEGKNTIIYGAHGSGKRMMLETLLHGLLSAHSARELNVYLLDMAGDGLGAYAAAPQVGDVVTGDEGEKLESLLRMLERELARRRRLLPMEESDIPTRLARAEVPNLFVILHALPAFCDWADARCDQLVKLLSDGPRYGMHFLATTPASGGISSRVMQHFPQKLVLQMASKDDYAVLLGNTRGLYPGSARGRGLVSDGELYEFQTACPQESAQALCGRLSAEWREPGAPSIPVMPERVSASVLQARMLRRKQPLQLPVGVDRETLNTAFLSGEKRCVFRIAGEAAQLSSFLTEWAACLAPTADVVVLNADGMVRRTPGVRLVEPEGWAACAEELLRERLARMDADDGTTLPGRITLVILTDIAQIWARLQTDCCSNGQPAGPEALAPMLMKAKPSWHLRFILCGERAAFEQLSHQAWYSAVSKGDAVFLGEGLTSQYTFEYKGRPVGVDAPFPWGYVITGGTARSARLVATEAEEAEEDEAW